VISFAFEPTARGLLCWSGPQRS